MIKITNIIFNSFTRIFNKINITKVLIIFIVGFISRILVNSFFNINVFLDYLNSISVIYYAIMSIFIVVIHEVISYFNINIIPSFISNFFVSLVNNFIKFFNNILFFFKIITKSNKMYLNSNNNDKINNSIPNIKEIKTNNILNMDNGESSSRRNRNSNSNSNNTESTNRSKRIKPRNFNRPSRNITPLSPVQEANRPELDSRPVYMAESRPIHEVDSRTIVEADSRSLTIEEAESYYRLHRPSYNSSINDSTNYIPYRPRDNSSINDSTNYIPYRPRDNSSNYQSNNNSQSSSNPQHIYMPYRPAETLSNNIASPSAYLPYRPRDIEDSSLLPNTSYSPTSPPAVNYANKPVNYDPDNRIQSHTAPDSSGLIPIGYSPNNSNGSLRTNETNHATIGTRSSIENRLDSNHVENISRFSDSSIDTVRPVPTGIPPLNDSLYYSSTEYIVEKKGLLGKLNLGFKYVNLKIHTSTDKLDSIYIKFHDMSKRKFFWTIWESKRGNYESYEDFKDSWNPDTKIWKEIKEKTREDMRSDIENMLGINKNINKNRIASSNSRSITNNNTRNITNEVNNLIHERQPFNVRNNSNSITNNDNTDINNRSNRTHRRHRRHRTPRI